MSEEEFYLPDVQDENVRYLSCIEEALSSVDAAEMRRHIQEAIVVGQSLADDLEELLNSTEDPDTAEGVEKAIRHLVASMDRAEEAIESPDDDIEGFVLEMRQYAERASDWVCQVV